MALSPSVNSPEKNHSARKMSHVVTSYVCRKNMFYKQTSLKGFSTFPTKSLAFSVASVIRALLKPFFAISLSSLRVLYRSAIHFISDGLITKSLRELKRNFNILSCFSSSQLFQHFIDNPRIVFVRNKRLGCLADTYV